MHPLAGLLAMLVKVLSAAAGACKQRIRRCCITLCRRKGEQPAWRLLLLSRDFGAIAVVNAIMFATANGSRSVLMPLLAHQAFGLTPTTLGARSPLPCHPCFSAPAERPAPASSCADAVLSFPFQLHKVPKV